MYLNVEEILILIICIIKMLFKKQMNFNSIFSDNFNNNIKVNKSDSEYYQQRLLDTYSQEKSYQVSNNSNLCSVVKGYILNEEIKNFCKYYCICNTPLQDDHPMDSLNQLVVNNFCCCNKEIRGNSNMSIPNNSLLTPNSIPQIYQEPENYRSGGNLIGDLKIAYTQQHLNSKTENASILKSKDFRQMDSIFQSQTSHQIGRRPFPGRQVLGSKITKRNMKYFEELQNYNYTLETKIDAESGKQYSIYVCNHLSGCRREFERPWNLLDHIRIHYDVRPHICRICNLRFIQRGNLNKHMLIHSRNSQSGITDYHQDEEITNNKVRTT